MSEAELASLVPWLSKPRPLAPWPWLDWLRATNEPDLAFRLRQAVWERFAALPRAVPVTLDWYDGARLRVQMGNELSRNLFVMGAYDANEFAFLGRYLQPGMVFADAGAHEGLYSLFAAKRVGRRGRVLAIEPSERERAIWQANLELNRCTAAMAACAIGETDGEAELVLAQDQRSGHNTLGAFAWGGVLAESRQTVRMRSLDSLAAEYRLDRLDALKMDIEGAESRALRGGARVFKELRPVVIVELSEGSLEAQGSSGGELLSLFAGYGYDLHGFDAATGLLTANLAGQTGSNLVAVPRERAAVVLGRCGARS